MGKVRKPSDSEICPEGLPFAEDFRETGSIILTETGSLILTDLT
jgi:hypothetical protein